MTAPLLAAVLALLAAAAPPAAADEALWARLRAGGTVVMIRHGSTDPTVGDPPRFRLGDCSTQRNLNETGRAEARRIAAAFKARDVPVGSVLSSQWCRCLETARLAFGTVKEWPALNSYFHDPAADARTTPSVRARIAATPAGPNVVMVTHNYNIRSVSGIAPAPGELVVLSPDGRGGFTVAGRLRPDQLGAP